MRPPLNCALAASALARRVRFRGDGSRRFYRYNCTDRGSKVKETRAGSHSSAVPANHTKKLSDTELN